MKSKDEFLNLAIDLALENLNRGGGPFGAVVVKGADLVGSGSNQVTTTFDPTAHAEIVAIRDACKNLGSFQLGGCTVYSSCEPCPMCLGALYWSRPDAIFFGASRKEAAQAGFDDAFIYAEVAKPLGERSIPIAQLKTQNYLEPFKIWDLKTDKIRY